MTQIVDEFIEYFKNLPDAEKFKLGREFNEKTGGKLSQYNNPVNVMVGLIQILDDDDYIKLLGVRRGIQPHVGGIALPGGFQEHMEEATVAVAREVLEETSLQTDPKDYVVFGNPVMSPTNNMLIFFKNQNIYPKSILKDLKLNSEVLEFVLIDEKTQLCFPLHDKVAKSFLVEESSVEEPVPSGKKKKF